jgi:hypothetical protein
MNYLQEEQKEIISKNTSINILKRQIKLLRNRMPKLKNISLENFENFTYMMYYLENHN